MPNKFRDICRDLDCFYLHENISSEDFYYLLGIADNMQNGDKMKQVIKRAAFSLYNLSSKLEDSQRINALAE